MKQHFEKDCKASANMLRLRHIVYYMQL